MENQTAAAWALWDGLAAGGVRHAVVSPGSRSTPLALAAAAHPDLTVHAMVDERMAAFFALGLAWRGQAAAVVCTSGSAPAHYHPAVLEARHGGVPAVFLTADRPVRLQDVGAPQTTAQRGLFGGAAVELAVELYAAHGARAAFRVGRQAAASARGPAPGPVHVNVYVDKPVEPLPDQPVVGRRFAGGPVHLGTLVPDGQALDAVRAAMAEARRGVILCGPLPPGIATDRLAAAVDALADAAGWWVFCDTASGLRGAVRSAGTVRYWELLLDAGAFDASPVDAVLAVGGPVSGWAYDRYCGRVGPVRRIALSPHRYVDPDNEAWAVVCGDLVQALENLARGMGAGRSAAGSAQRMDAVAASCVEAACAEPAWHEGAVVRSVVESLEAGDVVVVGNSLIVRDCDAVAVPRCAVVHQRGLAGIDGLLARAAGVAAAEHRPVAALVGDLTAAHDLGAVALLGRLGLPVLAVVVDNGGGRIFDALPVARQARFSGDLERVFRCDQQVDWSFASAFSVHCDQVRSLEQLRAAVERWRRRPGPALVHASVPGDGAWRRDLVDALRARLHTP